jgi:hypothetical protein
MPMTSGDLSRVLRNEAFIGTPPNNPRRAGQIERRIARRRRRQRAQVAIVAATILAVAGLSAVATRGVSGDPPPVNKATASPRPLPTVALPPATPVEKLWPRAATKLPAKLPNGRKYFPETFVDDHTLLVTTWSSFEKTDAVWLYDTETRRLRTVAQVTTPPKATTFASGFAVGDGSIAWWTARRDKGQTVADIWAAPLNGGGQHRVATTPAGKDSDGGIERLVIARGRAIWSLSTFSSGARGGVFTAPLTGGEPAEISGTDGYHIMDWPWIGTPGGRLGAPDGVAFRELRNVETGEQRTAKVGPGRWSCGLTWCASGTDHGQVLMRRDGSGGRLLPGGWTPMPEIAGDRFVLMAQRKTIQLYDLHTGRLADLGPPREPGTYRIIEPEAGLYWMDRADGYLVVNLAAIG